MNCRIRKSHYLRIIIVNKSTFFSLKDPELDWDDENEVLSKMTLLGYVSIADAVRGGVSEHGTFLQ